MNKELDELVAGLIARVEANKDTSLEAVLKGQAIELWSDRAGRLFLVADQEDVELLMKRYGANRGEIYTAAEVRRINRITNPEDVAAIHQFKREFNAMVRDVEEPL